MWSGLLIDWELSKPYELEESARALNRGRLVRMHILVKFETAYEP